MKRTIRHVTIALIILLLGWDYAVAQSASVTENTTPVQPTVTCLLPNGDRVSGRYVSSSSGNLTLETGYAGQLTLRLASVASCETSDPVLRVGLDNARAAANSIGQDAEQPEPPATQASSAPAKDTAEEKSKPPAVEAGSEEWKRNVAFSYAFARGNANINDMNLSGGLERKTPDGRFVVSGLMRRGAKNGEDFASLFTSVARYERKVESGFLSANSLSFFNEFGYEKDLLKKLDHRMAWNGGLQLPLFKKESNELALDLGGGITHEIYASDSQRTLGSGLVRLVSEQTVLGRTRLKQQFAAFPEFAEVGRYRLHADVSVSAPLTKVFSIRIGALNRFDSRPQQAVKRNDFSLLSGLAVDF